MRKIMVLLIAVGTLVMSGCATITGSEMQVVSLSAKGADGQAVEQAKCTLKNDKGLWEASTPGFTNVRRSAEDLMIECKKEGMASGFLRAISRAAGGMFGNIIFGGGIGAIIDHNKGTGYDYPNDLAVKMGASTTIDRRDEKLPANAQGGTGSNFNAASSTNPRNVVDMPNGADRERGN